MASRAGRLSSQPISHPGPTVGYRIEDDGGTLAYLTDHEPALGVDLRSVSPDWISGFAVARGADVLLHDGQYTDEEYETRVGWGHSSTEQVVAFGKITGAERLLLFHHDPLHTDSDLDSILTRARELWGDEDGCALAREGMEIDLS